VLILGIAGVAVGRVAVGSTRASRDGRGALLAVRGGAVLLTLVVGFLGPIHKEYKL